MKDKGESLSEDKIETFNKITQTLITLKDQYQKNVERFDSIEERLKKSRTASCVIGRKIINPGVEITIFDKKFYVNKPLVKAVLVLEGDEIKVGAYKEGKQV